jgi:peptidoglycan hydrolase-like protein with peptidoglycan-binding domain
VTNPNPALITDEMWALWENRPNSAWKLSGFYADKKGYHNTVNANKVKWPGNYSIRFPLDLKHGNQDKSRAIDLTMSDSEMVLWTKRMKAAAENPNDTRLQAVREFYGTLDNRTVFGMIKDSATGAWRRSTADLTHLWHGHTSIFAAFVNDWGMLSPLLSVWSGDTFEEWTSSGMFPKVSSTGEEVKYWQNKHNAVCGLYTPALVAIPVDGIYGPATVAAFTEFAKKNGAGADYKANQITGWLALKYDLALIKATAPAPVAEHIPDDKLRAMVDSWLTANIPGSVNFTGTMTGKMEL